jgi:hypothetical protein
MKVLANLGRAGEKTLKALIIATEDLVDNMGNFIEEGAEEYDRRHGNGSDDDAVQPWER